MRKGHSTWYFSNVPWTRLFQRSTRRRSREIIQRDQSEIRSSRRKEIDREISYFDVFFFRLIRCTIVKLVIVKALVLLLDFFWWTFVKMRKKNKRANSFHVQMPEEDAFAVLVFIMEEFNMRDMYKPDMFFLGLCIYQFECLVQVKSVIQVNLVISIENFRTLCPIFIDIFKTNTFTRRCTRRVGF